MVSCTRCTARFSASPEIEAIWAEMHDKRFHDTTRATAIAARRWRPTRESGRYHSASHRRGGPRTY